MLADILDEVESDYRADQLRAVATRYAGAAIAVVVFVLAAGAGWQAWQARRARADMNAATRYLAIAKSGDALIPGDSSGRAAVARQFDTLSQSAQAGYRTLALLREAALLADGGQLTQAQAIWDRISTDPQIDPLLRQVASLAWVERGLDSSDPAALRTRLVSITARDNPFHALGQEAQALLALRLGQADTARLILRRLAADPSTPDGVRGRAGALLSRLGN